MIVPAVISLFAIMVLLVEVGRRIGSRRQPNASEGAAAGLGAIEGAVFGLMGLMIAFTFSGAAARFDARRQLIVQETNAIGTAYLRLSLLPESAQSKLREDFRQYLDARLAYYRELPHDVAAASHEMDLATALQADIWKHAVEATRQIGPNAITWLVVQALNDMIDITTTRAVALQTHPPSVVLGMLIALVFACSLLAGYGTAPNKTRSSVHTTAFAAILAVTIVIILDYEYPRLGVIRIDPVDQVLAGLRKSMK